MMGTPFSDTFLDKGNIVSRSLAKLNPGADDIKSYQGVHVNRFWDICGVFMMFFVGARVKMMLKLHKETIACVYW